MSELEDTIQLLLNNTREIAQIEVQSKILRVVKSLHEQEKISDEVAHILFLELTIDMD